MKIISHNVERVIMHRFVMEQGNDRYICDGIVNEKGKEIDLQIRDAELNDVTDGEIIEAAQKKMEKFY